MVDAARGLLNEPTQAFWLDNANETIRWVSQGQTAQHKDTMRALAAKGLADDTSNDYVAQFVKMQSGSTAAGTAEYALPTDHERTLFVRYGTPPRLAERAPLQFEAMSKLSRFFGTQPDRALWSPGAGKFIRLYVAPGVDGVPQEVKVYELWYLKVPTKLAALATTLDVTDEYTEAIVAYTLKQAAIKLLKDPSAYDEWYKAAVERNA
jgi:hypothetical protein